jgi:hypothetical protein
MARRKIGRIRENIAYMMTKLGLPIQPHKIWIQEGAYRSVHWDLARWGFHTRWTKGTTVDKMDSKRPCITQPVTIYSWDKMSNCLKYGFELSPCPRDGWSFVEVSAKYPFTK